MPAVPTIVSCFKYIACLTSYWLLALQSWLVAAIHMLFDIIQRRVPGMHRLRIRIPYNKRNIISLCRVWTQMPLKSMYKSLFKQTSVMIWFVVLEQHTNKFKGLYEAIVEVLNVCTHFFAYSLHLFHSCRFASGFRAGQHGALVGMSACWCTVFDAADWISCLVPRLAGPCILDMGCIKARN